MWWWLAACVTIEPLNAKGRMSAGVVVDTGGPETTQSPSSPETSLPSSTYTTGETSTATNPAEDTADSTSSLTPMQAPVFVRRTLPPGCADPDQRTEDLLRRTLLTAEVVSEARLDGSAVIVADLFEDHRPAILFGGVNEVALYRAGTRGWEEVTTTALESLIPEPPLPQSST